MSSYRVTVLGEVGRPGVIPVSSEKMSIFEALAQAGDLTIYGVRNNVMLIREDQVGQKSIHRLNLNDANIINSPYYYLQQNDVIYVEPNKVKAKNSDVGTSTTMIFSVVGLVTSLATLVVSILRK
jgi:polysaccharide export protein, bexD/ctrA/vexA family